jgi:NAD(P)-dependent dehydrogenase (short-subunit alcohol dehydrogenase family)
MSNRDQKAIFITGSSSGLGRATAKLFASKGWKVIASMRDPKKEKERYSRVAIIAECRDACSLAQAEPSKADCGLCGSDRRIVVHNQDALRDGGSHGTSTVETEAQFQNVPMMRRRT